ncbi:MAG: NAD(P)H-dependent oxidoreductase subunit E [Anaerolineae bacterium]|nr:NAD(P)H-dependent oxidoreductase subunit E [Anaerolineae bacterium]
MIVEEINKNTVLDVVNDVVARHGASRDELIPILTEINQQIGYLPQEAMEAVSHQLRTPKSQLFSVATFYHMKNVAKMSFNSAKVLPATWLVGVKFGWLYKKPYT